jgi:hypothetical protein
MLAPWFRRREAPLNARQFPVRMPHGTTEALVPAGVDWATYLRQFVVPLDDPDAYGWSEDWSPAGELRWVRDLSQACRFSQAVQAWGRVRVWLPELLVEPGSPVVGDRRGVDHQAASRPRLG